MIFEIEIDEYRNILKAEIYVLSSTNMFNVY